MKRALLLSFLVHLTALGVVLWWHGNSAGPPQAAIRVVLEAPALASREGPPPGSESKKVPLPSSARTTKPEPGSKHEPDTPADFNIDPVPERTAPTFSVPLTPLGSGPETSPASFDPVPETVPSVSLPPSLVDFVSPPYPKEARRRGWEGVVEVEVEVDRQGSWVSGRIAASSGRDVLDQAALMALEKAQYRPASQDGAAVSGRLVARVTFRLE